MTEEEKEKYLLQKDIPNRFKFLSKSTINKLIKEGNFPPGKTILGRQVYNVAELEEWLDERGDDQT